MFLNIMLHDSVVPVSIDADIGFTSKAEIHNAAENAVSIRKACNTMDDMIKFYVIQPLTIVYLLVSWFRGG